MKFKKLLCGVLATTILASTSTITAVTSVSAKSLDNMSSIVTSSEDTDTTNNTNSNVHWSFDENTGTLTFSGTGNMKDYEWNFDESQYHQYCSKIKNVVIEDGVTSIGKKAFWGCENLEKIIIPSSVKSIGSNAFNGCPNLENINVDSENKYFSSLDGDLYNKDRTKIIQYAIGKKQNDFVVPNGITFIGDSAFYGCTNLTSVTIPNGVTSIGDSVFESCTSLTSITIPNGVTSIGDSAFNECKSLVNIAIPSSVTSIGYRSLINPDGVSIVGSDAFSNCPSLENINVDSENKYFSSLDGNLYNKDRTKIIQYAIGKKQNDFVVPNGVTSIGDSAFYGCTNLTNVTISNSVISIEGWAFYGCSNLKSITIPSSVTSISGSAFWKCPNLNDVYYLGSINEWKASKIYLYNVNVHCKTANVDYGWSKNISSNNLNKTVSINKPFTTKIKPNKGYIIDNIEVTMGNKKIKTSFTANECNVNIPKVTDNIYINVETEGIPYINMKTKNSIVKTTGSKPFKLNFTARNIVSYSSSNKKVAVVDKNGKITVKGVGKAIITVKARSFRGTTSVTKKVTLLVKKKQTITCSHSSFTKDIKSKPFYLNAKAKTKLSYSSSNKKVATVDSKGKVTIKGLGKTIIKIKAKDTSTYAQSYKTIKITVRGSVDVKMDFYKKSGLLVISGKGSIKQFPTDIYGEYIFPKYCSAVKSIQISEGITEIDSDFLAEFENCKKLYIPSTVSKITYGINNYELVSIKVNKNNKYFCSLNDVLYNKSKTKLIKYASGKKGNSFTIPKSVTSIGNGAFAGSKVKKVVIPNSVKNISEYAFSDCSNLETIKLPNGLKSIKKGVFRHCKNLEKINIPSSVKSIGVETFSECASLKTIKLPNGLKSIKEGVFWCCKNLEKINIPSSVKSIGVGTFSECASLKTIKLPNGLKSIKEGVFWHCENLTNITIPNGVTSIGDYAFGFCSNLKSVIFPDGVKSIGDSAFYRCSSLISVVIPNSVTSIGKCAFEYCSSLKTIKLSSNLKTINEDTFSVCSSLKSIAIPNNVVSIKERALEGCKNLTNITIPSSMASIGISAFENCPNLKDIYYKGSKTQWGFIEVYNNIFTLEEQNIKIHFAK